MIASGFYVLLGALRDGSSAIIFTLFYILFFGTFSAWDPWGLASFAAAMAVLGLVMIVLPHLAILLMRKEYLRKFSIREDVPILIALPIAFCVYTLCMTSGIKLDSLHVFVGFAVVVILAAPLVRRLITGSFVAS